MDYLQYPALAPPPGVIPNFDNPPGDNALGYGALTVCLAVTVLAVLVRFYAKVLCVKQVQIEDYAAFAGFGTFIGYIYMSYHRFAFLPAFAHQWDVRLVDLHLSLYVLYVGSILYAVTVMLVKASILQEWRRIFVPRGTRNMFYYTCYGMMIFNVLFYSASIIAVNLSCRPYKKIWDKTIMEGECINTTALELAGAIINLTSDLVVLLLPQRTIWSLRMSLRKKIGVSVVFAVGILACVAGSFRLATTTKFFYTEDIIYEVSPLTLWAGAEMTCAFLVFCAPSVPKAFGSQGPATRLASSLRSINSKMFGKKEGASPGGSWWSRKSNMTSQTDRYSEIQRGNVPHQRHTMAYADASTSRENLQGNQLGMHEILRTTDVDTREHSFNNETYSYSNEGAWDGHVRHEQV